MREDGCREEKLEIRKKLIEMTPQKKEWIFKSKTHSLETKRRGRGIEEEFL